MYPIKTLLAALCLSFAVLSVEATAEEQAPAPPADAPAQAEDAQAAEAPADTPTPPAASKQDISFSIGYSIGKDMAQRGADLDADHIVQGIRAGLGVEESRLTEEQVAQCLFSFQTQMQQRYMQEHQRQAQENLAKGQAYLAENAKQQGVSVTESGLQYRVLQQGDGPTPTLNNVVSARYVGTLIDGTEFDRSEGDETVSFPVAQVIPGWVEALQMMKVGDKWELTIPADLAYGEQGTPQGVIGPNQVLRFEIELVGIE